jgi:two-component system response regulator ChvI
MTYGVEPAWPDSRGVFHRPVQPIVETGIFSAKLIFIDADDLYRDVVKSELMEAGFSVLDFPSGEAAAASLLSGTKADLIIIDWGADKAKGGDFLKEIRDTGIDLPVVVLMERSSTVHERFALGQGAADFIDKSRGTDIVAARVRLVLAGNRRLRAPGNVVERGRLSLEGGRAYWGGVDVNLTAGEFKIVQLLAVRAGEHATYRQIYDALHYTGFVAGCGEEGYRANVRGAIKRIRCKFKELDPGWDEITNYIGYGYSWGKRAESEPLSGR